LIRRTLPLDEVAERIGQPVERLREWCATGLLACDRVAGTWALPESELPAAHRLGAVGPRLATSAAAQESRLIVVAFDDHASARRALDAIRRETGVQPTDVELAPLSIDGMVRILVAGRVPATESARIEAIVVACDGRVIDGTEGLGRQPAHREDEPARIDGVGA
jgi:hypothetical protein